MPTTNSRNNGARDQIVADVVERRVLATDVRLGARALEGSGHDVVAELLMRSSVSVACGAVAGRRRADVLRLVVDRLWTKRRCAPGAASPPPDACAAPRSDAVDDDQDRAVEAGAEARGEQVVGLARGRSSGAVPASAVPSRVPSTGAARTTSITMAANGSVAGRRDDESAPAARSAASRPASESSASRRKEFGDRCDARPREHAGSREIARARDDHGQGGAQPILVTNGMPIRNSPEIEIATVRPAKMTARPAVATAVPRRPPATGRRPAPGGTASG